MKTEIHTMAELNDNFIGCIHRQLTDRHMLYTKEFTSDGCLAQDTFSGVLKVTVLVFNVLLDNTQYTLTVSGHPVGQGVIAPNFNLMDHILAFCAFPLHLIGEVYILLQRLHNQL